MKTILELIESWKPCYRYWDYVSNNRLKAGMTIDDILRSKYIRTQDKDWFFDKILNQGYRNRYVSVLIFPNHVEVFYSTYSYTEEPKTYTYSYSAFLAMVDEYLGHANIDAAI